MFKFFTQNKNTLLLSGILLIALNLRTSLASVGPLVENIRATTGLSNVLIGLLTTLPLIAFGTISILAPIFTKKFGIGRVLLAATVLLTAGIIIRSMDWLPALYIGTFLLGIAIAFGNVLLPTLTKQNFATHSGLVTSLYSSTMAIGAALAAGISAPLAENYSLDWRGSLRIWAIVSTLAFLLWIPQIFRLKKVKTNNNYFLAMRNMLKQKLAWKVALYMGFQSFTFYVILAWLPALLISRGFDSVHAGWMLSLCQAASIFGSLLIPILGGKKSNQRALVAKLIGLEIIGFLGLLFPVLGLEWLWITIIGFNLGGAFGLALLFLVLRANNTETASHLSGMAQSIGYFIAALGPILIGRLYDITGSWTYPIISLIILATFKLFMGLEAGKEATVNSFSQE